MNRKHLLHIKVIIANFLKKNGGYSNGYMTVINASFRRNTMSQDIGLKLPNSDEKTGRELRELGNKLNDEIRKYLDINQLDEVIKVESHHVEHGAYEMNVSYTVSERVSFV